MANSYYFRLLFLHCMTAGLLIGCSISAPVKIDTAARHEISTRINYGMQRLGASPARGECYANRISDALLGEEAAEAADLIERAYSKNEMRESVIAASAPIRKAFITAHFGCSLTS